MARKRKKKKSWFKTLLFFILTPFIIWSLAFVLWLYWDPITRSLNKSTDRSIPRLNARRNIDSSARSNATGAKGGQEHILDEERQRLNEILKSQHSNK